MKLKGCWFNFVGRVLMVVLLRLLSDWEVSGKENIPKEGPILVVSNHMNNCDPPLLAVSISRRLIFMAKEELFRSRVSGYLIQGFGAFPVYRGRHNIEAMRKAKSVLDAGWGLVMFPEGMRSRNGKLLHAFPGSAIIAAKNDAIILPVGITGTEKIVGVSWFFKRPKIMVNIGKPFKVSHNGKISREQLNQITDSIMYHIAELLPCEYHGCYRLEN
jgi:1-acyl-sn-glycerol-3-phosphate acyltransferase